ncbi:MAG: hypothetical protein ACE5E9_00445 [Nitrospinaceae bacterium]
MSLRLATILLLFTVWTLGAAVCGHAEPTGYLNRISRANDLYLNKKYREAAGIYEDLIGQGLQNGYLYYNLGNTYMRLDKIGPAILNYIKAKRLLPRDESLNANFRYAFRKTKDQIEPTSTGWLRTIFFWLDDFNLREHLQILVFISLLFWITVTFWYIRRTGGWDLARKSMLTILLTSLISTGAKIGVESHSRIGVVLPVEMDVKSALGPENVTLFQLHEGAIVSVLDHQEGWYRIDLSDGNNGWVPENFIGL